MALPKTERVLFRIPDGSGIDDEVLVDACVSEQHTLSNTLTDHPVEQGFNVTDHSRPEPRRLQLECIQSNTPLDELAGLVEGDDRAHDLWRRFVDLHSNPRLLEVQTARDYYRSVGIESVSSPLDVKSAQALRFTIGLKEVRVVANKFTRVVPTTDPRGQATQKKGAVTTSPDDSGKSSSILHDLFGKKP